ncbi:MAG: hypothetical protein JST92_17840, partial [Deltaproteobacteria bacterium]|nr:hypothetical protein [Deltaproteobacteria bacterium]
MTPNSSTLLLWITFLPLAGALAVLAAVTLRGAGVLTSALTDRLSRLTALVTSGAVLALCAPLLRAFDPADPKIQLAFRARWIPAWNIQLFLGVDGLSIWLIVLSAFISFIATLASLPWLQGKLALGAHHFTQEKVP